MPRSSRGSRMSRNAVLAAALAALASLGGTPAVPAEARQGHAPPVHGEDHAGRCPPEGVALRYSDALDKRSVGGVALGGLSAVDYDRRRHSYVAVTDNRDANSLARLWFFRGGDRPAVTGSLVLRKPDGTPYTGAETDNEGLAVLPGGDYLVSSETTSSIRMFGRDGRQRATLPVPRRFAPAPDGDAERNATLEGLTVSRGGRHVYAAMEGSLRADRSAGGDARLRRILVYRRAGTDYRLARQIGYRVDSGMRVAEVASYAGDRLLTLEITWQRGVGNTARLYAVPHAGTAPDVSAIPNLARESELVPRKHLVADLTRCPDLGAPANQPQINPLLDNYEGMVLRGGNAPGRPALLRLVSDDNFNAAQITRLLTMGVRLP